MRPSNTAVIVRQRVRAKRAPMTGSGGRSSKHDIVRDYWVPRFRGDDSRRQGAENEERIPRKYHNRVRILFFSS